MVYVICYGSQFVDLKINPVYPVYIPLKYFIQRWFSQKTGQSDTMREDYEGKVDNPEKSVEQSEASIKDVKIFSQSSVGVFYQNQSESIIGIG